MAAGSRPGGPPNARQCPEGGKAARLASPDAAVLPEPARASAAERARPLRSQTDAGNYFIAASYIFATYSQFTR
jgi:hypothetical protein